MKKKKTITVFIEFGTDFTYNAYTLEDLPYGLLGEGKNTKEAMLDFEACYEEIKETYEEEGMEFTEFDFDYKLDIQSFFNSIDKIIPMTTLSVLTGINDKQLHHYKSGSKKPRKAQKEKIEGAIHYLGQNLIEISLV